MVNYDIFSTEVDAKEAINACNWRVISIYWNDKNNRITVWHE